jgi:hypothetical protein
MVLHDEVLVLVAKIVGNSLAFLLGKDYAPKGRIDGEIIVKHARICDINLSWKGNVELARDSMLE